jgi:hypothetical protein
MAFSYQPFATTAIFLRLILISSTAEKTPATSGGLKLGGQFLSLLTFEAKPDQTGRCLSPQKLGRKRKDK